MRATRTNTRRIVRTFYRSWWRRPFWLVTTFIFVPLIVGRIMLNPLLKKAVRHHLDGLSNVASATFADLDVSLFPPSFSFRDVAVRGPSGEVLYMDHLEIHLASWQDLGGPVPHARLRFVHPHLRVTGAGDLERWIRALPAVRFDATGVEKGTITNAATTDGRVIVQDVNGDMEGLVTGATTGVALRPEAAQAPHQPPAVIGAGWQASMTARLDGIDQLHAFIKVEPSGTWAVNLIVHQIASGGGPAGNGPVTLDARAEGAATGARVVSTIGWSGAEVPVAIAQDRANRASGGWPTSGLTISELRAGHGANGPLLEVVMVSGPERVSAPLALATRPLDVVALVEDVVRLTNQALLPPR